MQLDGDICFSRFEGWLKQHRPSALSASQTFLLGEAFPGFLATEATRAVRTMVETPVHADFTVDFDPANPARKIYVTAKSPRRFAGDENFPSGRYHIVALDGQGHDLGTLLGELSAYARPADKPVIAVSDLCDAAVAEFHNLPQQMALFLIFYPEECERPEIKRAFEAAVRGPGGDVFEIDGPGGRSRAIRIPYAVERAVIENVIDLRLPATQAWFARAFGVERRHVFVNIHGRPEASRKLTANARQDHARLFPLPSRFVDMLPALLVAEIGGGHSVQKAMACWMRLNGVAGLIFPSARMNCGVRVRDGEVIGFRGWNFVDYRGAPPAPSDGMIDLANWPDSLGDGVQIIYATNQEYAGSWYLKGYEELQARERNQSLVGSTDPSLAARQAPAIPSRDPVADLIAAMAKALSGDDGARQFITAAMRGMAESGSPALADGVGRVLAGERDSHAIARALGLSSGEQQLLAAFIPPAPRPKLPAFKTSQEAGIDKKISPEMDFQAGPDWFLFSPGGRYLQIRCPQCGWQDLWDRGEEEAPQACPDCGFHARPA